MEICCFFKSIARGSCGFDRRDRKQDTQVIPWISCTKEISSHTASYHFSSIRDEVDLILSRAGVFRQPANVGSMIICPLHRSKLGLGWIKGTNARCRVPALLSNHGKKSTTWPKCDRGIGKSDSQVILTKTGVFLQVGSGKMLLQYFFLFDICFFTFSEKV